MYKLYKLKYIVPDCIVDNVVQKGELYVVTYVIKSYKQNDFKLQKW